MSDATEVPRVWVVASLRELQKPGPGAQPQCYTVMDQAGTRTLLNMGLQPMSYPCAPLERLPQLLADADGVLLGGSDTNVHPSLYGEEPIRDDLLFDRDRDELAHHLVRIAIASQVPVIGFCRGSQDINVAMGGSLHQCLKDLPGSVKHWEDPDENVEEQYIERHFVTAVPGGELERIAEMGRFPASSLHMQGVKELGPDLVAEAHADDGLVEAFRYKDARSFAWGFQFHPEWGWRWHPAYGRIMNAFVRACWDRHARRTGAAIPGRQVTA